MADEDGRTNLSGAESVTNDPRRWIDHTDTPRNRLAALHANVEAMWMHAAQDAHVAIATGDMQVAGVYARLAKALEPCLNELRAQGFGRIAPNMLRGP